MDSALPASVFSRKNVAFALWGSLMKFNRVSMIAPFNVVIPIVGAVLSAIFPGKR